MNSFIFFANVILLLHIIYICVVVLSVPLIILGGVYGWQWVRNVWFRLTHLAMIGIVVAESLLKTTCPLTTWENQLRESAGTQIYNDKGFIADWLHALIFYDFPSWVFTLIYTTFCLLVLGLLYAVPMRGYKKKEQRFS